MAVASAGPYANLHIAPDKQPRQHPTTQFFTGRMPFLPPNQQRQSTEGELLHRMRKQTTHIIRRTIPTDSHATLGNIHVCLFQ